MTDKLRFTRAQMRNAAIIAKDEGVCIQIHADGSMMVTPVIPDNHNRSPIDVPHVTDLDRELEAFEARHGYS